MTETTQPQPAFIVLRTDITGTPATFVCEAAAIPMALIGRLQVALTMRQEIDEMGSHPSPNGDHVQILPSIMLNVSNGEEEMQLAHDVLEVFVNYNIKRTFPDASQPAALWVITT